MHAFMELFGFKLIWIKAEKRSSLKRKMKVFNIRLCIYYRRNNTWKNMTKVFEPRVTQDKNMYVCWRKQVETEIETKSQLNLLAQ